MHSVLQEKIFNKFSNLYSERHLPMTQTCMCWGLACGSGWFDLLWKMSEKLEALNFKSLKITQVKEKFGTLRVYYDVSEPNIYFKKKTAKNRRRKNRFWKTVNYKIDQIIFEAEKSSSKTCEACGKPGKRLGKSSWSRINCEECAQIP